MTDGPVFILGNHRSGTTWVHELLAETGQVDYLRTADVVAIDRGIEAEAARRLVADELARHGMRHRAFDEVALSPDAPDEYCQVLLNAAGPANGHLNPRTLGVFERMCARLRAASGGRRPLVLKSPWDYRHFRYIDRAVPGARFVFVHRHPERVVHSSLRLSRTLAGACDPYYALILRLYAEMWRRPWLVALARLAAGERLDLGVRLTVLQVAAANAYYVRHVGALPDERILTLRYEDLCAEPEHWRARLFAFCGIEAGAAGPFTPSRPRGGALLPEVVRWRPVIARVTAPYMAMHGYRPGEA